MKNLKVRIKILLLTAIAFVLMLAIGLTGYVNSQRLAENSSHMYNENLLSVAWVNQIRTNNRALQAFMLEMILSPDVNRDAALKQNIIDREARNEALHKNMDQLTSLHETEAKEWMAYKKIYVDYKAAYGQVIDFAVQNKMQDAYGLYINISTMVDQLNGSLTLLSDELQNEAEGSHMASAEAARSADLFIIIVILIGLSILVGAGYYISRTIVKPLQAMQSLMAKAEAGDMTVQGTYRSKDEIGQLTQSFNVMIEGLRSLVLKVNDSALTLSASSEELIASAEQTTRASEQIASATNQMAAGFDEQVKNIVKASEAATHMAQSIVMIKQNGTEVNQLSEEAAAATHTGVQAIESVLGQMKEIDQNVRETQGIIVALSAHSNEIGTIITAINDIASQTNLLSLNASIEAARAGEAGRGFAVVAGEIRKLADAAAQSSNQIAEIIETIQSQTKQAVESMARGADQVSHGVERSQQASASFGMIEVAITDVVKKVHELEDKVVEVSQESQEIAAAMQRVSGISQEGAAGVQQTSAASQEQLAAMEEVASSAQSLSQLAEELSVTLDRFAL